MGTAFDYRLRFFFDAQPDVQSLVAHKGAIELDSHIRDAVVINLGGDRQAHSKRWDMLADFISRSLLIFGPQGADLTPELEMAFARVRCLLARLDVPARVANKLAWGDDLIALGPDASIGQHMAIVSEPVATDVAALMVAARTGPLSSDLRERFVPNPRFPGSRNARCRRGLRSRRHARRAQDEF